VYAIKQQSFGSAGWISPIPDSEDVNSGSTYGTFSNGTGYYMVEFERALQTNNPYEMQIDHNGTYRFAFALFNDYKFEDHAVSETYDLNFDNVITSPTSTTTPTTTTSSNSTTTTSTHTNNTSSNSTNPTIAGFNFGYIIPIFITSLITLDIVIRKKHGLK
jgi:cytochrome b558/566 subunit A